MSRLSNMSSIYIPHVFGNITKEYIIKTFEFQGIGKVKNVDFVEKMGKNGIYNTAFVHLEHWYDNIASVHFQQRVQDPNKEARIVYSDPWFWVCFENTGKKIVPGQRKERININAFYGSNKEDLETGSEEVKSDLAVCAPMKIQDILERELLSEFGCDDYNDTMAVSTDTIYNIINNKNKKIIDMEYVKQLEMLNYKLIHDLYELRGDFIMV